MLVSVRKAYQGTIEALARTVEAQNPDKRGHAERVSELASEVGRQLGLRGSELERLAYAALLHDLGDVGQEQDDEEGTFTSAQMVENVSFLEPVVPVLKALSSAEASEASAPEDGLLAYVVVIASRTDDLAHDREVERDSALLRRLGSRIPGDSRTRVERAFRLSSEKIQGVLFAVGDDFRP
jgi:hypothetical protein